MQPGRVYRHEDFYRNDETGNPEPKYLVILAALPSGDFVAKTVNKQVALAPRNPTVLPRTPFPELFPLKSRAPHA